MPDTIQKQILDVMDARLRLPSVVNGYSVTIAKVERARLTPFKDYDLPAVNYWPESDIKVSAGGGYEVRQMKVLIEVHDATRDQPFTDVAMGMANDLWIALWRDVAAGAVADPISPSLGGLVSGIYLETVTPEVGEGQTPFCGALLEITVEYRRRPDAPFVIST